MIQAVSYIGITIAYVRIHGSELAYAVYIPLDLAIFIAMTAFYVYYYYQDLRQKRMTEKLLEIKNKME